MKIAILGRGNVGGAIGDALSRAGHEVVYAERGRQQAAVTPAEAVIVALPWPVTREVLSSLDLAGKVVVDCTNPLLADLSGLEPGESGGERVAQWARGARVVKAFNSTGANNMADPVYSGRPIPMFYCGDDAGAKDVVRKLVADVGFSPVDTGALANSRQLEAVAMTWIWLAFHGMGREFAFQIERR